MRTITTLSRVNRLLRATPALIMALASHASADAVTDWNEYAVRATKGFNGTTGTGAALGSNFASRVDAIVARAVFDAVNSIDHFLPEGYYYSTNNTGSASAAAAQAAHDVLLAQLPNPAVDAAADVRWAPVRTWLDQALADYLAELAVPSDDPGIVAGKAAAAAANAARSFDSSAPVTTYGPLLTPVSNPGVGVWRQSNAAAVFVDPTTGAPTGFDAAGVIQGRPGVDLNFRDVLPFSLSVRERASLVSRVPLSPDVGSTEYERELDYVKKLGRDTSNVRTSDQTAQALFYKQDAEIFVFEAARVASEARGLSLDENAALFAVLASAVADARIAAFASKYEQRFWRPITALNADADGTVRNDYRAWHPLAATPSHPSNTAGHSTTAAAGAEILRAYFGDNLLPNGRSVELGTLPWLVGTNNGTGKTTTRRVSTFTQIQLENGASRLYLGVHYGFDNWQGQLLGISVADAILLHDPAAVGLRIPNSPASLVRLGATLLLRPDLYGFYGRSTEARP
jgi:PAP2 superfamily